MEKRRCNSNYQYSPENTHITTYRPNVRSPMRRTVHQRTELRPKTSTRPSTDRHVTFRITPDDKLPPAHEATASTFKNLSHRPRIAKEEQSVTSQQRIEELTHEVGGLRQKLARSESTIDALIMFYQSVEKSCQTLNLSLAA